METQEANNEVEVMEQELDMLATEESDDADLETHRGYGYNLYEDGNIREQLPAEPMVVDQTSSSSPEPSVESAPGVPGPSGERPVAGHDPAGNYYVSSSSDDSWTEEERLLLLNASDIFGDVHDLERVTRLSQMIGTRTPGQVRLYLDRRGLAAITRSVVNNFDEAVSAEQSTSDTDRPRTASSEDQVSEEVTPEEEVTSEEVTPEEEVTAEEVTPEEVTAEEVTAEEVTAEEIPVPMETVIASESTASVSAQMVPGRPGRASCSSYAGMSNKRKIPPEKRRIMRKNSHLVMARKTEHTESRKRKISESLSSNSDNETKDMTFGEQVKISKACDDSDTDIDIETAEVQKKLVDSDETILAAAARADLGSGSPTDDSIEDYLSEEEEVEVEVETYSLEGLTELDEVTSDWIFSENVPTRELILERNSLLPLEGWFYRQYFSKNPTTSEETYLRIRNHIINAWSASKPNYITNSSARQGLRGDVNRLARIFKFLEQIGAINFGSERVDYIRPLAKLAQQIKQTAKEKSEQLLNLVVSRSERRVPQRKEEFCSDGKGGCTTIHDEQGNIIDTIIIKEKPKKKSPKKTVKLISCSFFTRKNPQKIRVRIHLSALLLMNFHAHILRIEVIGLIGGDWDPVLKIMTISTYQPCRNLVLSETCCDMDPISQVESTERIQSQGFSVLGWFHSHPAFAPEPSEQDISTQYTMQHMMSNHYPCLGIILTPNVLCEENSNLMYRCFSVEGPEEKRVPYSYRVEVLSEGFDVQDFFEKAEELFSSNEIQVSLDEHKFNKVALARAVTNLRRYLSSRHVHLDRTTCDSIVTGISDIFRRQERDDC